MREEKCGRNSHRQVGCVYSQIEILQRTIQNGRFPVEIRFYYKLKWILLALVLSRAQLEFAGHSQPRSGRRSKTLEVRDQEPAKCVCAMLSNCLTGNNFTY